MTTPQDVRAQIERVINEAENDSGGSDVTVALERLDRALELVLAELESPISGDSMVVMNQARMCRQLGAALGLRGP